MKYFFLFTFLLYAANTHSLPLRGMNTNGFLYNFSGQVFTPPYVDTLNKLQPEVLRFPGGTIANKYHFSKSGYGQNSNFDKKTAQNYIVEFVRLVKSMEHPPKVLFVVNMFEHFYKPTVSDWDLLVENLAAIKYLKRMGVEVVGVELGNEFCIYPVIRGWDIKLSAAEKKKIENSTSDKDWPDNYKKYNRLARLYQMAIKKIDPNIQTAIPMGSATNKNHKKWNAYALKMNFSDAYVQHWYGQINNSKTEEEAMKSFQKYTDRVAKNIRDLQTSGKKIWITEWNGIDFGFDNNRNMQWKQTPLHVRFNLLSQQLFDSLQVDITIYHRLSTGPDGDTYNLFNVDQGKITVNSTYWEFLKPPFVNNFK